MRLQLMGLQGDTHTDKCSDENSGTKKTCIPRGVGVVMYLALDVFLLRFGWTSRENGHDSQRRIHAAGDVRACTLCSINFAHLLPLVLPT